MSWKTPFEQRWPEPAEDLRQRFGIDLPSFSPREIAALMATFLLVMALVVLAIEALL